MPYEEEGAPNKPVAPSARSLFQRDGEERLRVCFDTAAQLATMASYKPKSVKDVPAEDFIKAYSAHLKANDKARN